MDRKEKLSYSLLDVFGLEPSNSSKTRSLMESYGILPVHIVPRAARTVTVEIIHEAVAAGTIPLLETVEPEPTPHRTQRDDVVLQRWREMAGIDGGSAQ